MMRCPDCDSLDVKVIDSRPKGVGNAVRRRRQCKACGERFTTYEQTAVGESTSPVSLEEMVRQVKQQIREIERAIAPLPDGGMEWDADWQGIGVGMNVAPVDAPCSRGLVLPVLPDATFRAA